MSRRDQVRAKQLGSFVLVMACLTLAGVRETGMGRMGAAVTRSAAGDRSLSFEPNVGQAAAGVDFVARGRGYTLSLRPAGAVLTLNGATVVTELLGGRRSADAAGGDPLPGRVNYLGRDAATTRTDVPTYGQVTYPGVYDGVDVVYYGAVGRLEYDFAVAPGADPSSIRIRFSGVDGMALEPNGDLVAELAGGRLVQHAPVAYQEVDGRRRAVEAAYLRLGDTEVGFRLGTYDPRHPLVIDPVLAYSTYIGGTSGDHGEDIAVDGSGNAYIVGSTFSFDYPHTPGAVQGAGGNQMVVTKLGPGGDLAYSTYLGGTDGETGAGIAVDAAGNAYVTGTTSSSDFPTVNPVQPALARTTDAVVVKLNPSGSQLLYSTYLGGTANDTGRAIAVDAGGNAYVTGWTESSDFPRANAVQPVLHGGADAFLTKLASSGSALVYSTYLGGSGTDAGYGVGVDAAGSAVVGGHTSSTDFPTRSPLQAQQRGPADGFVTKVTPAGTDLVYSTYLGGTAYDTVSDLALDTAGHAYVTGITTSADFPTVNPLQASPLGAAGTENAFVTKLGPSGGAVYSTYLGGPGEDLGVGITVDSSGRATVTGYTSSSAFPTVNPIQPSRSGLSDAFVSTLAPNGSSLAFSTYFGGSGDDTGRAVAADPAGAIHLVGDTRSTDLPLRNPVQAGIKGGQFAEDIFVAKMALTAPAVAGSTWYTSGSSSQSGGPGTVVSAYAVGAFENVAYRLVLATGDGCSSVVAVLNPSTRFADTSGFIGRTVGTVPGWVPAGSYQVCFHAQNGATATGGPPFTVT